MYDRCITYLYLKSTVNVNYLCVCTFAVKQC